MSETIKRHRCISCKFLRITKEQYCCNYYFGGTFMSEEVSKALKVCDCYERIPRKVKKRL